MTVQENIRGDFERSNAVYHRPTSTRHLAHTRLRTLVPLPGAPREACTYTELPLAASPLHYSVHNDHVRIRRDADNGTLGESVLSASPGTARNPGIAPHTA